MQILPPIVMPTTPAPTARSGVTWQVGQLLSAEVIGTPAPNHTRLRIGAEAVTARSDLPLKVGEKLQLRVVANAPNVVLQVRAPATDAPASAAIGRGLAHSLPRQGTAMDTLTLVRTLDRFASARDVDGGRRGPTPTAVLREAASAFVARLPSTTDLASPARLRAAVVATATPPEARLREESHAPQAGRPRADGVAGGTLEALQQLRRHLPQTSPGVERAATTADVAADGSRAAAAARTPDVGKPTMSGPPGSASIPAAPGVVAAAGVAETDMDTLRGLVDGAIARIQTQHLSSAAQTPGAPWHLGLELPVRHGDRADLWQFDFEGDERPARADDAATTARVTLRLVLNDTVTFTAHLASGADGLRVRVAADDPTYAAAMAAAIGELEHALRARALVVAGIVVGATVAAPKHGPVVPCALVDVAV